MCKNIKRCSIFKTLRLYWEKVYNGYIIHGKMFRLISAKSRKKHGFQKINQGLRNLGKTTQCWITPG